MNHAYPVGMNFSPTPKRLRDFGRVETVIREEGGDLDRPVFLRFMIKLGTWPTGLNLYELQFLQIQDLRTRIRTALVLEGSETA